MTRTIIIAAVLIAALLDVTWILYPAPAQAGYYRTVTRCDEFRFHCHKKRIWVESKKKRRLNYYADPDWRRNWPEDEDDGNKRPECTGRIIEIVSTEHTTTDNAMEAARKIWAAQVNWKEGAQYQNLKLARRKREGCGPSDPMDTFSGRLNEAVSGALGGTGQNVRCIIRAEPCREILQPMEGTR